MKVAGIPSEFIDAVKLNNHLLKLHGRVFKGPTVHSGVRQCCPLSGLLSAICADVLLLKLQDILHDKDEVSRAFADDTAVVIHYYAKCVATPANLFRDYAKISGLDHNINKTLFIPLWPLSDVKGLRKLITEMMPAWRDIQIDTKGKYRGFIIRPGADNHNWDAPLQKYEQRIQTWDTQKSGLVWNSVYHNTFAVSTLEYVAQLEEIPEHIREAERAVFRKLARGPGNWISKEDLENLNRYGLGPGSRLVAYTAMAAKLRVLINIGSNRTIWEHSERIRTAQLNHPSRPFDGWHTRSYAKNLSDNRHLHRQHGIEIKGLQRQQKDL